MSEFIVQQQISPVTSYPDFVRCPICDSGHLPIAGNLYNGVYSCTCENCGHFFKFRAFGGKKNEINFTVNGVKYTVGNEYNAATSLAEWLRQTGVSRGTKGCCYQGGCGVCLVTIKLLDPVTKQNKLEYPVNSCCVQLYTLDGMEITTIEGLGKPKKLHAIQKRLADYNGTQCGFCSPAQVMNMYGLLQRDPNPSAEKIEDIYDTTVCRCTGYRPILDAMKSFASDEKKLVDIEELNSKICEKSGKPCSGVCSSAPPPKLVHIVANGAQWYKPTSVDQLTDLLKQYKSQSYKLVFGNTGFGVYGDVGPWMFDVLIDIRGISEFYQIKVEKEAVVGSNLSITNLLDFFTENINNPAMPYSKDFAEHLKLTATSSIRNLGCWAGNLMLKHLHNEFASDIFTILETINTKLVIVDGDTKSTTEYSLLNFLKLDMKGKAIVAMKMPVYESQEYHIKTYRASLRLQACVSYIAAGFRFLLDSTQNYLVKERPSIIYQGINERFAHAAATELYLEGKELGDPAVLKAALLSLEKELRPAKSKEGSQAYRKSLGISLFYKFVLNVCKAKVDPRFKSGGEGIDRPLQKGYQHYYSDSSEYPVSKPMVKTTADYLTSGVVKYLDDLPTELNAAVVLSSIGSGKIDKIDASAALKIPGVVAFLTAKDIPGLNNWRPVGIFGGAKEELLSSGEIGFAGQPVGLIIADIATTAETAASTVQVSYKDVKMPIVDLQEAIAKQSFHPDPPKPLIVGDAKAAIAKAENKISGTIACGDQYHFHLETQTSVCEPTDVGGMKVKASTQWMDGVLETVAQVLDLVESDVTVEVERLGGGFGGKITQNFQVSGLCAMAAQHVGRPVKLRLSLGTNMKMSGKRIPYFCKYQVGFNNQGVLEGIVMEVYSDCGYVKLDSGGGSYTHWMDNAYYCPNWFWQMTDCKTNKAGNTACRSPGSFPAIFIMESIIDHVAASLKEDPLVVRKRNLYKKNQVTPIGMPLKYCSITEVVNDLAKQINLVDRKKAVETFNKENRWKKRGISVMPNRFAIGWNGGNYTTSMCVYHGDASLSIEHGGIDMGQGINTKVIQVCAYELGVPMKKIRVKTSRSITSPNSQATGGSITSELCCLAVIEACKILKQRMAPVKAHMKHPTWEELVSACFAKGINMAVVYLTNPQGPYPDTYNTWSAACVEAEIDVLTGQYQLRQMDMLYDCGLSLNPELDIGQAEGGFIMGLGYLLTEEMHYDPNTAQATNADTWGYKPPLPKDLPVKFNFWFQKNDANPVGVLRSKAVGEPPVTMASAAVLAIKHAIQAARKDTGVETHFSLDAPATVEKIQGLCLNKVADYKFG